MFKFDGISKYCNNFEDFIGLFPSVLAIFGDFGILGFSKILGFFQRFLGIFDEVYEDFQSNLPLGQKYVRRKYGFSDTLFTFFEQICIKFVQRS
jgi:hypothetical protein